MGIACMNHCKARRRVSHEKKNLSPQRPQRGERSTAPSGEGGFVLGRR